MTTIDRIYTDSELFQLRDNIHHMAREKGWWPDVNVSGQCNFPPGLLEEKLVLVSTELSEAYEVYRDGIKLDAVWLSVTPPGFGQDLQPGKPEGFPVELADAYIRILDLMGALELGPRQVVISASEREPTVGTGIFKVLKFIVWAGDCGVGPVGGQAMAELSILLSEALATIEELAHGFHVDLKSAIEQKIAYNATRQFRHGGKKA